MVPHGAQLNPSDVDVGGAEQEPFSSMVLSNRGEDGELFGAVPVPGAAQRSV